MPGPTNYNNSGIMFRIDPTAMWHDSSVELLNVAKQIGDSIENIIQIWDGLRLGWMGSSADEAQDFANRFNANLSHMFGSNADPSSGVLPRVATAVEGAAINFGVTEDTVWRMFESLNSGLTQPGSPNTPPARSDVGGQVIEKTP